jgi:methylated-DNA-[protein]-cysteine S-methyltransferase
MGNGKKSAGFAYKAYMAARKIPRGWVSAYSDVARAAGCPGSARAVGNALNKNSFAPDIPCHRVVKADGSVGGFNRGSAAKIRMLKSEGILVINGKIVDFEKIRFKP